MISHRMFVAALEPAAGRPIGTVNPSVDVEPKRAPAGRNDRSPNDSKRHGLATLFRPVLAAENGVVGA